jgi:hypothetical protein
MSYYSGLSADEQRQSELDAQETRAQRFRIAQVRDYQAQFHTREFLQGQLACKLRERNQLDIAIAHLQRVLDLGPTPASEPTEPRD